MKTAVIILILGVICYFAFKSLYKTLTGKKGCGCSGNKKSTCPARDMCGEKKKK